MCLTQSDVFQHCSGDDESDEPSGQSDVTSTSLHPVVFRWHGEGHKVFLSGSYDGWETKIPLVRRYCLHS